MLISSKRSIDWEELSRDTFAVVLLFEVDIEVEQLEFETKKKLNNSYLTNNKGLYIRAGKPLKKQDKLLEEQSDTVKYWVINKQEVNPNRKMYSIQPTY